MLKHNKGKGCFPRGPVAPAARYNVTQNIASRKLPQRVYADDLMTYRFIDLTIDLIY